VVDFSFTPIGRTAFDLESWLAGWPFGAGWMDQWMQLDCECTDKYDSELGIRRSIGLIVRKWGDEIGSERRSGLEWKGA